MSREQYIKNHVARISKHVNDLPPKKIEDFIGSLLWDAEGPIEDAAWFQANEYTGSIIADYHLEVFGHSSCINLLISILKKTHPYTWESKIPRDISSFILNQSLIELIIKLGQNHQTQKYENIAREALFFELCNKFLDLPLDNQTLEVIFNQIKVKTYPKGHGPATDVRISLYEYLKNEFLVFSLTEKAMPKYGLLAKVLNNRIKLADEFLTISSPSEEEFIVTVCAFLVSLKPAEMIDLIQNMRDLTLQAYNFADKLVDGEYENRIRLEDSKIIIDEKEYNLPQEALQIASKLIIAFKSGDREGKTLSSLMPGLMPEKRMRDFFRSIHAKLFMTKFLWKDEGNRWNFIYRP